MVGLLEPATNHLVRIAANDAAPRILSEHVCAHHAETTTVQEWPEEYDSDGQDYRDRCDVLLSLSPSLIDPAYEAALIKGYHSPKSSTVLDCLNQSLSGL